VAQKPPGGFPAGFSFLKAAFSELTLSHPVAQKPLGGFLGGLNVSLTMQQYIC